MGLLNFKKCVFGLKNDFLSVKENKKVTNYLFNKVSTIFDIEDLKL